MERGEVPGISVDLKPHPFESSYFNAIKKGVIETIRVGEQIPDIQIRTMIIEQLESLNFLKARVVYGSIYMDLGDMFPSLRGVTIPLDYQYPFYINEQPVKNIILPYIIPIHPERFTKAIEIKDNIIKMWFPNDIISIFTPNGMWVHKEVLLFRPSFTVNNAPRKVSMVVFEAGETRYAYITEDLRFDFDLQSHGTHE